MAAVREGHYSLKHLVSEVMGIDEGDLKRPGRREAVGLGELAQYLCEDWFKSTRPD
jgi:hypothetical protein